MRIAVLGLVAVLLAGCTGGEEEPEFDAARYRGGDCAVASRVVFEIEGEVAPVVAGDREPADAVSRLRDRQDELRELMPSLSDTGVKDRAQTVVDAVGFYRIGLDAKNYTPKLAKDVGTAARRFLSGCSVS